MSEWVKKSKGNAIIYKHPDIDRAIVVGFGITFNGLRFLSLEDAKKYAEIEYVNGS